MNDLLIDPSIRMWVFIPIVVITFFVGVIRHYLTAMLQAKKSTDLDRIHDTQLVLSTRNLRMNGYIIPKSSFLSRKYAFNNDQNGLLLTKRNQTSPNIMTDPTMMITMLKGNLVNVLPMILIGSWINWMLSGFITTRVPFPLTFRFKSMLQRGIELSQLDSSWVSSASWYFLNVFGLRSIFTLVLGENNAADQSRQMQEQMVGNMLPQSQDMKPIFKAEWEALEIADPIWIGDSIDTYFFESDNNNNNNNNNNSNNDNDDDSDSDHDIIDSEDLEVFN